MPLTLEDKKVLVEEISSELKNSSWCILTDVIGLKVSEVNELRNKARESGVNIKVYKNRLIKRAIDEQDDSGELGKLVSHLKGPTAVAFVSEDPIIASKMFVDFAEDNKNFTIKAAVLDAKYLSPEEIKELSKLGSMASIYGKLILAMKAPMYKLINALQGPGSSLVGTLKSIAEKG